MSSPSRGPPRGMDFGWRLRNVVPNRRDSNPPFLGRLVDFSFRDPEAVVQPPVSGVVCLEPYRGDDRAVDGRSLLDDAVSFDGDEDLRAVGRGNRPVQVRTPDKIFAPPRMIRPVHRPADPRTHDVTLPGPEAGGLVLAVRGQPRPFAIQHSQRAKFLEPHRPPPGASRDAIWSLRNRDYFGTFAQSSRNRFSPTSVRACCVIFFKTSKGSVTISAPSFAASMTCKGWRMDATRTSQSQS